VSTGAVERRGAAGMGRDLHTPNRRLQLGPSHALGQGCARIEAELDGETVVDLAVDVGLGHRGFEKAAEGRSWYQITPLVERLQPDAAPLVATAWCEAVEALLVVEPPDRARWLRVLAGELARAASHFGRIAAAALAVEVATPVQYALQARERMGDLLEVLSGARQGQDFVRIGGVARGMPASFPARCMDAIRAVGRGLRDVDGLLGGNRLFVRRLQGTGVLSGEDCLAWSLTGPVARAAGISRDLRRVEPGPVYDELEFDIAVGRHGDNLDRYLVYVEEIRQSLRVVAQCCQRLEALGPGRFASDDRRLTWPGRSARPDSIEALTAHTMAVIEGPLVPASETRSAVESVNGEIGFTVVADGGSRPVRLRCRAPSFFHLQALPAMLRGAPLGDLPPTLALLGVAGAECDR
jgi:NADH-quinone oxidoreductase subunit D